MIQQQEHCHRHVPPFGGCLIPTFVHCTPCTFFCNIFLIRSGNTPPWDQRWCTSTSLQYSRFQTFAISSCFPNHTISEVFLFQTHWIIILSTRGLALPTSLPRALWGSTTTWWVLACRSVSFGARKFHYCWELLCFGDFVKLKRLSCCETAFADHRVDDLLHVRLVHLGLALAVLWQRVQRWVSTWTTSAPGNLNTWAEHFVHLSTFEHMNSEHLDNLCT